MNSGSRLVGAAAIALFAVWAGLRLHGVHHAGLSAGVPVPVGEASAPSGRDGGIPEAALAPPVIPLRLPEFSLADLAGNPTSISTWRGKSLMINFWATWCAPCRREIPLLETLAAEWADKDLSVVGIAVDYREKVRAFAGEFKIEYPLLLGEQDALDVAAQFGFQTPAFPFTVFTDRRGEVVALFVGELHRPQAEFILSQVQSLNQDRIRLQEARRAISETLSAMSEKHTS